MPSDITLPLATVYAFIVVLARVAGALIFVPIPGSTASPEPARAALIICFTLALFPQWPSISVVPGMGQLAGWILAEAALGITIGLVVSFLTEAFLLCGQIVGLQAGYSFASTIDPNTQSDSTVLSTLAQLMASMLYFTLGLHRDVLRIFSASLDKVPPGSFIIQPVTAETIIGLGSAIFSTGFRLALPVVALLVMVDLTLALLGRINSQLQLITLAFPVKMLTSLALLSVVIAMFPRVYRALAGQLFDVLPALVR